MKPDPILEELWAIKDKLAREAGYDVDRFIQNLQEWEKVHLPIGRVIGSPEEFHQFKVEEESRRAAVKDLALNETPPRKE